MSETPNLNYLDYIYRNYVENKFHKVPGLFFSLIILVLSFIFIHQFIRNDFDYEWLFLIIFILGTMVSWFFYRFYLPKNKDGKLGVVIAIYVDESYDKIKLKNNFIRVLRKKLKNEAVSKYIKLIVLKNHFCESLDSPADIEKINESINANLFIYGDVRCANDLENKIFINLNGYVTHYPVNLNISKELAFHFSLDHEIESFAKPLPQNLKILKNKIPFILSNECLLLSRFFYNKDNVRKSRVWLNESFKYNNNNYGFWLLKAIYEFRDNNVQESLASIKMAEKYSGGNYYEWLYSKVFLLLWLDKYEEAFKACKKLSSLTFLNEDFTVLEVENFNLKLCENNSDKPVIYFWLGYLNLRKKNDLKCAKIYFEYFMNK